MDTLREKRTSLAEVWLSRVLESEETGRFAKKLQMDPFTNPVHWTIRESLGKLLEVLFSDENKDYLKKYSDKNLNTDKASETAEEKKLKQALDDILRLRAVQAVKPGQATAFLFQLKEILEKEAAGLNDPKASEKLKYYYEIIDLFVLVGFDIYMDCREQLFKIKIDEFRRNPYPGFDVTLSCSSKTVNGSSPEDEKCS